MKLIATVCALFVFLCAARVTAEEQKANPRTDWFQKAKFGVFMHYMADTVLKDATPESWNKAVDSFDVEGLADQLASAGAGYFVLTLGQNSGFYCSPNPSYDNIVGITPSKCSTRDLPAELSAALKKRGVRLMVYLPAGAPDRDPDAMEKLEWRPGKFPLWSYKNGKPGGEDLRLESFQKKWESVISDWSKRWSANVCGWWFDGCYYPDAMYRHPDAPNFDSFAGAARAGNSNSIVAFNPGVENPIINLTPVEDYTAGEINNPDKVKCDGPRVGKAQFQMLSYLGPNWCQKPPRFTADQVIEYTRNITEKGGVVTWDVPPDGVNGLIPDAFLQQIHAVGKALGAVR